MVLASYLEIYNEKIYDLLTGTHKASGTNQATVTYLAYCILSTAHAMPHCMFIVTQVGPVHSC